MRGILCIECVSTYCITISISNETGRRQHYGYEERPCGCPLFLFTRTATTIPASVCFVFVGRIQKLIVYISIVWYSDTCFPSWTGAIDQLCLFCCGVILGGVLLSACIPTMMLTPRHINMALAFLLVSRFSRSMRTHGWSQLALS